MTEQIPSAEQIPSTEQKALTININTAIYGTFAEIGAGQEVARCFFRVGGAAGTVAKTMSAYDMKVSDDIYGKASRYVSKERLLQMLSHEYELLTQRLAPSRGETTTFFTFANTVSARNFKGTNECHGWMGIRCQSSPGKPPRDLILHVRMKDKENILQQQAIGIVGVNLIYAAYYYRDNDERFVSSLLDGLSVDRVEVDMMEVNDPESTNIDNRVVSLKLLQLGLTNAVMFGADKTVYQPSEVLHKKPVLVERGSFRPITHVNVDMMKCAEAQFKRLPLVEGKEVVPLMEITLENLVGSGSSVDLKDFLDRVDSVAPLGYRVLVTNYPEFYRLPFYFRNYSQEPIAFVMGLNTLRQIFDPKFYTHLDGGLLEACGRLFHTELRLFVYPMTLEGFRRYSSASDSGTLAQLPPGKSIIEAQDVLVAPNQRHLLAHLIENGQVQNLKDVSKEHLDIFSRDVLKLIKEKNSDWERFVPEAAVRVIKERGLFSR